MRSIMAAALALAATAAHAQQQPQCAPTETLIKILADQYGERPVSYGTSAAGVILLFASADGSTWTLTLSQGRVLCIISDGTDWVTPSAAPAPAPKKPDGGA